MHYWLLVATAEVLKALNGNGYSNCLLQGFQGIWLLLHWSLLPCMFPVCVYSFMYLPANELMFFSLKRWSSSGRCNILFGKGSLLHAPQINCMSVIILYDEQNLCLYFHCRCKQQWLPVKKKPPYFPSEIKSTTRMVLCRFQ